MLDFFQNQILGMKWLHGIFAGALDSLGIDTTGRIGGSILFFLFDFTKISVLLTVLIFIISCIQSFFPPERSRKILGRFHGISANSVAALLGTVTPFCSCSSIPIFMGFTKAGLPLGVTFSFLISSPMVDLGSLVLLMGIFGWKVAVIYVVLGLVIAIIGGSFIESLRLEDQVEDFIKDSREKPGQKTKFSLVSANGQTKLSPLSPAQNSVCCCGQKQVQKNEGMTMSERVKSSWKSVASTYRKVVPYILAGVGIGAVIHNWIPENWIVSALGSSNPLGVMIATILGVPMYADIFGTIPIAESLLAKGALLGVVLSFMMAVTTLSLPSMVMLSKAIKPKLLGIFIGICVTGIAITGYVFNLIQPLIM